MGATLYIDTSVMRSLDRGMKGRAILGGLLWLSFSPWLVCFLLPSRNPHQRQLGKKKYGAVVLNVVRGTLTRDQRYVWSVLLAVLMRAEMFYFGVSYGVFFKLCKYF